MIRVTNSIGVRVRVCVRDYVCVCVSITGVRITNIVSAIVLLIISIVTTIVLVVL